jgi:23S rRNA pseudouridine2605 synthase
MNTPPQGGPSRPEGPRSPRRPTEASSAKIGERLAKRIARAGLCSRREAEAWIRAGRVAVDGVTVESPALDVTPEQRITVDGRPLPEPEPTRLFRWHKPRGVVVTARDPEGRPTYLERLPPGLPRLVPVGRLDLNSEGLLLLTNDGELKRRLELPSTGWTRRYRVRAFGKVDEKALAELARGTVVDGVAYGPIEAKIDQVRGANLWLTVSLKEGKNREVRRVLESLGLVVNRLIRVAYGPFQLGNLPRGAIEEVPRKVLREQLGAAFAPAPSRARRSPARAASGSVEAEW